MFHRGFQSPSSWRCAVALLLSATVLAGCTGGSPQGGGGTADPPQPPDPVPASGPLPRVTPQPSEISRLGDDVRVTGTVDLVVDPLADRPTRELAKRVLRQAGAERVLEREPGQRPEGAALRVRIGNRAGATNMRGLQRAGMDASEKLGEEGYQLAVIADAETPQVVIGAQATPGAYYGVQTLRQLTSPGRIAGAKVTDAPATPIRGAIEGFYGSPWTHEERMDQLAFYGENKLNTYVYAPKDDPYHRERWYEPYPEDELGELRELIGQAQRHHVKFTFALHPGTSLCFSDPEDVAQLQGKLQQLYDNGVRDFQVLFDDIDYASWNCAGDRAAYGPASPEAAGRAQAEVLNRVQREFIATHPGAEPLQTVPTEYSEIEDSPYKTALRGALDPDVQLMWTGDGVIPDGITTADARQAEEVWGRSPMIWDNYPVNDFDAAEGRLMLGPYAEREKGLSEHISGVVVNPMNQAAASKVVEVGAAAFAWNDEDFDPRRAWRAAADQLAGDSFLGEPGLRPDRRTAEALVVFFDLNHRAPLADGEPWLPPAPRLAERIGSFRAAWDRGDRAAAVAELRRYAERVQGAPERIRQGADANFVADAEPWLRATDLSGDALVHTVNALQARVGGDRQRAAAEFDRAARAQQQAEQVRTIPGETRPQGPVRLADGVLDEFVAGAPQL
ncbi:beta-N-acetylhexosaminidase family protein [Salinifilum ghardaiensis]